jgi:hypothetical protein
MHAWVQIPPELPNKTTMRNVPDDWNEYWTECQRCGNQYHLADGCCNCYDMEDHEVEQMLETKYEQEIIEYEYNRP